MSLPTVASIEDHLRQAGYDVARDVELPAAAESGGAHGYVPVRSALVASKFYFCWKCVSYISQNIFVAEVPDAGVFHLDNLAAAGAQFSRQNRSPLSYLSVMEKGFLHQSFSGVAPQMKVRGSYVIIPIVITKAPHPDILARCAAKPRLTMPMFRLPSVIDADNGAMYYYRGRAIWGGGVLSEMRSVASQLIAPAVAAAKAT